MVCRRDHRRLRIGDRAATECHAGRLLRSFEWRTISPSARPVRKDRAGQKGKKSHQHRTAPRKRNVFLSTSPTFNRPAAAGCEPKSRLISSRGNRLQLRQIVVVSLARQAYRHLAQSFYSVGIVTIITRTHFPPAGPIVHHFLLVPQVSKVGTDHWTKFFV